MVRGGAVLGTCAMSTAMPHPSTNHNPSAADVAAMSDETIRAYKRYYVRLLLCRSLLLMAVMGMGVLGPREGTLGVVSAFCALGSVFVGLPFGLALGWSTRFDQHLNTIGKGPFQ